jgi:hypothetical protein
MNFMYERRGAREKSKARQGYLAGLKYNTAIILAIARQGTLEECLDVVDGALRHDLEYLVKTEARREAIRQHIKNFHEARNNLDALRNRPAEYRRQAAGYIDDYKIGRVIPKDGMHEALRSYAGHLKSRDSQYLAPEETAFIAAQEDLAAEIAKRYIALQRKVLGRGK